MNKRIIGSIVMSATFALVLLGASLFLSGGSTASAGMPVVGVQSGNAAQAKTTAVRPAGVWQDVAGLPTIAISPTPGSYPVRVKRNAAAAFPPNGKIYSFGGRHGIDGEDTTLRNIFEYTPGTPGTWATKAGLLDDVPVGSRWTANMAVAVLTDTQGVKIYAIGGSNIDSSPTNRVRVYNPVDDTVNYLTQPDLWPATPARLPGGWAVHNNKLYIFGGYTSIGGGTVFADTWRFDPMAAVGSKWTQVSSANLSVARGFIAGTMLDGFIYAIGGDTFTPTPPYLVPNATVERMNPNDASPVWTTVASLPTARGDLGAWAYDTGTNYEISGRIAVAGGPFPTPDATGYLYDPGTNSWGSFPSMVHATRNFGRAQLNGYLYAIGGYNFANGQPDGANFVQRYDATSGGGTPTNTITGTPPTSTRTNTVGISTSTTTRTVTRTATMTTTPVAGPCNPTPITINDSGPASPYPSNINITGMGGTVTDVNVILNGLNHTWPDDVDMLLVGPGGQTANIMSDAGGSLDIVSANVTLDDEAATQLPDSGQISSGSYRPANYEVGDTFPAPAPAPGTNELLSVFDGTSANGTWSLYIVDDTGADVGSVSGGWCLVITTTGGGSTPSATNTTVVSTGTPTPCTTGTVDVAVTNFSFTPQTVTVAAGSTVRWTNNAGSHTSTSDTGVWDSGNIPVGQSFSFTFNTPGTYPYHCTIHPQSMTGTVIVTGGCASATVVPSTSTSTALVPTVTVVPPTATRSVTSVVNTSTAVSTNTTVASTSTSTSVSTSTIVASTSTIVPSTSTTVLGTSTRTTVASTSTSVSTSVSTNTAVAATATACSIRFSDVMTGDTFYDNIRCLACRFIISGYSDGTFRPNADITRGQIAKMVSNAANFQENIDAEDQTYQDVPPTHTFYQFIQRLTVRGIMGGYPCGLIVTEPCAGASNKPYFRPFSNATRGQLAKIVSNAAGYNDAQTGQFFTDVPTSNPFYIWIMRLTTRGIVTGYPCGTVNPQTGQTEPCDAQSRPYYRWANFVTRGQASKIVANAFFPNCVTP